MTSYLLSRSLGLTGPQALQKAQTTRLLNALQASPNVRFDSSDNTGVRKYHEDGSTDDVWAHRTGVNTLVIDKFESR